MSTPTELPSVPPAHPSHQGTSTVVRVIVVAVAALAVWGAVALNHNASNATFSTPSGGFDADSSDQLPRGPIGESACEDAVADAQAEVPGVIADAQAEVDRMIAENPELAPYAEDTKRMLAESAPAVRQNLADAGHSLGC